MLLKSPLLLAFLVLAGGAQESALSGAGGEIVVEPSEELAPLRESLFERVSAGAIRSLVVVAIRDGEVVWSEGFGWADSRRSAPAGLETVYPVASMSKSITGLAATLLLREGRLSLDAPVRGALGELPLKVGPGAAREPVVADLAAMKAGMPHGGIVWLRDLPEPEAASARVVRDFAVVATTPGNEVAYSNYTTGLLERVVAHASGVGFTRFVQERILAPLGMTRTAASPLLLPAGSVVAAVHSDGQALPDPPLFTPTGGQGYYSCASDLAGLALAHLGERAPSESAPSAAALAASRWPGEPGRLGPADYAWMGWGRFASEAGRFELTNGQVMSSTSALLLCAEKGAAVVCLTNTQWAGRAGGERLADSVAMQAMEALVPGCLDAYRMAAARAEAGERAAAQPALRPEACAGEWEGTLVLGERRHEARLQVAPELSATLRLDGFEARSRRLGFQGPELVGSFDSTHELPFLDESGPVSDLSIALRLDEAGRLVGHAIVGVFAAGRKATGTGAGLLTLTRVDAAGGR